MVRVIKCLRDQVLVRPGSPDEVDDGIIIPESAKEKESGEGVVLVVGPDVVDVKVGDRVYFSMYAGDEVKIAGVVHKILPEENVHAIIEDLPF